MQYIRGSQLAPDGAKLRQSKPRDGVRRCECGRRISRYNPHETCWEHTPTDFGRIRGRPYEGKGK